MSDTVGSARTWTLNHQIVFDSMTGDVIHRVRPNGRQQLLRTDNPSDGLTDRGEVGRHFVTNFISEASAFEDSRGVIPYRDVFDDRFALEFRLDEFFEVVDFRQQVVFEMIDQLFGKLLGVRELLA